MRKYKIYLHWAKARLNQQAGIVALSQAKLVKAASRGITVNKRTAAAVLVYLFPVACSSAAKLSHVSECEC